MSKIKPDRVREPCRSSASQLKISNDLARNRMWGKKLSVRTGKTKNPTPNFPPFDAKSFEIKVIWQNEEKISAVFLVPFSRFPRVRGLVFLDVPYPTKPRRFCTLNNGYRVP